MGYAEEPLTSVLIAGDAELVNYLSLKLIPNKNKGRFFIRIRLKWNKIITIL